MARKLFTLAALATVPVGVLVALGTGPVQAAAPVVFKGNISCSVVGTATFKPELSNKQTKAPTTGTFKGTNNDCKGLDGTKLTQGGETLTGSTDSFSVTLPANSSGSCADLETGTAPAITVTVDWTGSSPIAPSTLAFSAGTASTSGMLEYTKGKSTGSFAGTAMVILQIKSISLSGGGTLPWSVANFEKACAGKGIADFKFIEPKKPPKPFGPKDNLLVGPKF